MGRLTHIVCRIKSLDDFKKFKDLNIYQGFILKDLKAGGELVKKVEVHLSAAFIGHLDKKVIEIN